MNPSPVTNLRLASPNSYYIYQYSCRKGKTSTKLKKDHTKYTCGTKTSQTTSILQPWERETKVRLIKKARLREALKGFVNSISELGILQNLYALTG